MRGAEHIGQFENKRLVIRQQICYHTGVKSKGELESLAIAWIPRNQCGPAWSASTTFQYTEHAREVSLHQVACHFPLLVWHSLVSHTKGKERAYEAVLLWGTRL
jgi:hypothetical protein